MTRLVGEPAADGALVAVGAAARPKPWVGPIALLLLLAASAVLFWDGVHSLMAQWEDTDNLTYTHGYLVVAVSAWLLWRAKPFARDARVAPQLWVLPAVALLSVLWLLLHRACIAIGYQLLLPLIAWTAAHAAFGRHVSRRCLFALAYLYFAVPVWGFGNGLLQSATVVASRFIVSLVGIPAYFEDNYVHLPAGVIEIAGGCSGLHFFIVALAIAALHGEVNDDTPRVRLAMLAVAAGLAILANWVRVAVLIFIGYATDMEHYFVKVDHYWFGWVVFAVAMVAFFVIARWLPPRQVERVSERMDSSPTRGRTPALAVLAAIAAMGVGPVWGIAMPVDTGAAGRAGGLPRDVATWQGPYHVVEHDWQPVYEGADVQERAEYRADGLRLTAFTAGYFSQRQGKELIGYDNSITGNMTQYVTATSQRRDDTLVATEILFDRGGKRSVLYYYYEVGSKRTLNDRAAQLLYGWLSLFASPTARVVAVYADCASECAVERDAVAGFIAALQSRQAVTRTVTKKK